MKIAEMVPSERPRERLMQKGVHALSTTELLAVLLGSGSKERSVLSLSSHILSHFSSIQKLLEASISELTEIPGIGPAKALQLKAAFGLAMRYSDQRQRAVFGNDAIYEWIRSDFFAAKEEKLVGICLDVHRRAFHKEVLSHGNLSEVLVHPREVFHFAIKNKAHSLIVVHNHPSGDARPSRADLAITKQLCSCGQLLGIPLVDHLIIGKESYFSIASLSNGADLLK